ncbi:MAG: type IV fimbrial biogenesis protein FimT [Halioglobus sp.]|jgi:type IV fimbrial biogenesis protein FimT
MSFRTAASLQDGFTLVELMITLVIASVLMSIGAPSFNKMVRDNRMVAEANSLRGVLSSARSAAQTLRATVTLCRSEDGLTCSAGDWNVGYIAFMDTDQDGVLDDPDDADGEQILQRGQAPSALVAIDFSQGANVLRFDRSGNTLGTSGTFTFCDMRGAKEARGIVVSPVGALRSARELGAGGDNSSDIIDDHTGEDVSCNA